MKKFFKPKVRPCWLDFIPHEKLEDVRNDVIRLLQPQLHRNFLSLIPLQEIRDPNGQKLLKVYDAVYNSSCAMLRNCYNLKYYIDRLMEPIRPSPAFPIGLSGGLSQFCEEVRPYVTSEDSKLNVQIEPGIGAVCSFNLLQIALLNLLSNSMLCNQREQTITIRLTSQGEYAEITVIDEGIGMSPFALKRAFDVMVSAPVMTTACNSEPMGIGLPLALKCAEYDGGSIAIRSTPEAGTEVRLRYLKSANGSPVSDWFDSVRYDNFTDIPVLLSSACNVSAVLRTLRRRS